jgi:hypothetical protein
MRDQFARDIINIGKEKHCQVISLSAWETGLGRGTDWLYPYPVDPKSLQA